MGRGREGAMSATAAESLIERLLAEVFDTAHQYAPGLDPAVPSMTPIVRGWRPAASRWRERCRDLLERSAARAGFSHRHFDPVTAAARMRRVLELADGLEETYARLGDDASRRALVDVLKLRVLGPYHARLRFSPEQFRERQAWLDREFLLEQGTFAVSDPYFSPISLYEMPIDGAGSIRLHAHSVDLVAVYVNRQYEYRSGHTVQARSGDVVFDIGGCWGDTALYFASRVGPTGKVFTFEFDPESLHILRANLALNPHLVSRIEVVERALWDRTDEVLEVAQAGRCTQVRECAPDGASLEVPTVTLDDFMVQRGLDRVDLVKMDVEGAEPRVLAGATQTLADLAPRLAIAAYHRDDDLVALPRAILEAEERYSLYLGSFSPVEDETVLFADATERRRST
jgi:FkbM family methyltransferase